MTIERVAERDLDDLLPLLRAYCDFYEATTPDEDLLAVSRALIADPEREGVQLIARDGDGRAVGFATLYWSWSTLSAGRIGVMNDIFVAPDARGGGLADALIAACVDRCREHGAKLLEWDTALDNERAQAVYDRVGGTQSRWLSYSLRISDAD
jgi:GNAT superfamily N-acetyltransferase